MASDNGTHTVQGMSLRPSKMYNMNGEQTVNSVGPLLLKSNILVLLVTGRTMYYIIVRYYCTIKVISNILYYILVLYEQHI